MRMTWCKTGLAAGALVVTLCAAPSVMAAAAESTDTSGNTSGPAAGTQTTPSTALQKQGSVSNNGHAAGGPGVEGKKGAESGPASKESSANASALQPR
jgi:hypothetical protein